MIFSWFYTRYQISIYEEAFFGLLLMLQSKKMSDILGVFACAMDGKRILSLPMRMECSSGTAAKKEYNNISFLKARLQTFDNSFLSTSTIATSDS